jgi:tetratricopeptide (TPR) repeat protein
MGRIALARGNAAAAKEWLIRAIAVDPRPETLVTLADALIELLDFQAAARQCRAAIALSPDYPEAHHTLGVALGMVKDYAGAIGSLREALRHRPQFLVAHIDLGRLLIAAGRYLEAKTELERVLAHAPKQPSALVFHGIACHELGEFATAIESFEKALVVEPDPATLCSLAAVHRDSGNLPKAIERYEKALEQAPGSAEVRNDYAITLLAGGEFERGWDLYESRWEANNWPDRAWYRQPPWQGQPLAGKSLLVWGEQGIGDQMMFASLLPELLPQAGSCTVVCEKKLVRLFERSFPAAQIVERRTRAHDQLLQEPFDYQIGIASLGQHFRRSFADFPRHAGYLRADPRKVEAWRERLAALGPGRKVAISWKGGFVGTRRHLRSIDLEAWLPILKTPGVEFISLQYTEGAAAEVEALREKHGITVHHWPEVIEDYDETAALVCALERVVSVCTALIHLTGAMGRPAWILVPAVPEWRYMREGSRMPWYPAVELYRQPRIGEWNEVIERVSERLRGSTV